MRNEHDDRGEFAKHFQAVWLERACDDLSPYWLRVACLAYGTHGVNGHAPFKRGELGARLADGAKDVDRRRISQAIKTAVERGWLAQGSHSMCLRVPDSAIEKGRLGAKRNPCYVCQRRSRP